MQLQETGPTDPPLLVGCPGCPKCIQHHGYTLHLSAGRPTKSHEHLFLLAKAERYFYDADAIREPVLPASIARGQYGHSSFGKGQFVGSPTDKRHQNGKAVAKVADLYNPLGRNRRSVWTIATEPYPEAHFATFPTDLVKPCILAGSRPGDTVLDPFGGSGTTCFVAKELGRAFIGIELNPDYIALAEKRLRQEVLSL